MAARGGLTTLRLHLCQLAELAADSELNYELLDARRRIIRRGRDVPAALPKGHQTELVIAGPDVLLIDARLPRLSGTRLRAALAGIVEPAVLGDIERAFVVTGQSDAEGRAVLAVVDRVLFKRTMELCARVGMEIVSATPEPLTLAIRPGVWRLRAAENYSCLRIGGDLGISCSRLEPAEPPAELQLALSRHSERRPNLIEVDGPCDTAAWSEALGIAVTVIKQEDLYAVPVAYDLLQYEFAIRMVDWRAWQLPAMLAAALAVTLLTGLNVEAWLMAREAQQTREQMNAVFRQAFPDVSAILDPMLQAKRALADLRTGAGTANSSDFVPLATKFAETAQVASDAIRGLEYRDRSLVVRLEPRSVDTPQKREVLVERLTRAGFNARFLESTLTVRVGGKS